MDWIVTTARTVEEAQTRALDLLGVDSADAEIQVVEEGKTGLFGRTKSEARVRARIKPKAPPAKEERRQGRGGDRNRNRGKGGSNQGDGDRNRGKGGGGGRNSNKGDGDRNRNRGDGNKNSGRNKGDGNKGGRNRNNDGGEKVGAAAAGGGNNRGSRDDGGRNRNRNDRGGNDRGGNNRGRDRGNNRNRGSRNNEDRVEMPVEEQRETLETFVTGVATAFDSNAKVTLVEEGTTLLAEVTGENLGRLVGNKASTLQSLEELARTAMHRAAAGRRYHRIQVDVDNYRARRREALAKFATDLATTVAETGESKAMEPMGAADRKLIHDAVSSVAGVETVSEGRDPRRYIVLLATDSSDEEE